MNVFYWVAIAAVVVLSSARITRLLTYDKFPPVLWLRTKYEDATDGTGWQLLAFCAYCMSFWVTAFVVGWAYLSGVFDPLSESPAVTVWWLVNSTFAASYLAATYMVHDGEPDEDDEDAA